MERDFLIEAYDAQEHDENESLAHHGIKGQHWGIRRYQNMDGSLTPEGRRHWGIGDAIRGAKTNVQKYVKSKKAAALRNKKNSILARGDVNEILKNKHLFTTKELDKAISRSQRLSMLKAMSPEEKAAREKEIKAQQNAAKGKEFVDKAIYYSAQMIQMAPAMFQCYAIVKGLFGGSGGGNPPTPPPGGSGSGNPPSGGSGGHGGGNPPTPPSGGSGGHGGGNPPTPPSGGSGGHGGGNPPTPPSGGSGGSGGHGGGNPPTPPSGGSSGHGGGNPPTPPSGGSGGHGGHGNNLSDITQSIVDAAPIISSNLAEAHDVTIGSLTDPFIVSDNTGAKMYGPTPGSGSPGYNLDALFD